MPLPILFIGIAVATGAVGIGKTTKAGFDQHNARMLNENSDERMEEAANRLNTYRKQCEKSLEMLGEEKLFSRCICVMQQVDKHRDRISKEHEQENNCYRTVGLYQNFANSQNGCQ